VAGCERDRPLDECQPGLVGERAERVGGVELGGVRRVAGVIAPRHIWLTETPRELLKALYVDEIDAVCQAAATITGDSPEAILVAWLGRFCAYYTSKRFAAAALLEHTDRDDPVFGAGYARVLDASRPLLRAAQESGQIRTGLTLEQILDMVAAIAKIPGDAGYREPILRTALDALRPAKDG